MRRSVLSHRRLESTHHPGTPGLACSNAEVCIIDSDYRERDAFTEGIFDSLCCSASLSRAVPGPQVSMDLLSDLFNVELVIFHNPR